MIREKLYRDTIHDIIALDKNSPEDCVLIELIDSPEMQRLRRIRQLGLASLAYQGAEHSRFNHSMGAMWLATRILLQLSKERPIPPRMAFATRCAALLHDIGHGPLSHVFESFLGVSHEEWTNRIILDKNSNVNKILRAYHLSFPREVAGIIAGKSHPRFLTQIISSQLDADRFDYLLRDSTMTGVKYGIFDLERLIRVLRLDNRGENIVVNYNGVQAVEKYLQARYHMYSQVYLHKTVRAGETLFGKLLLRASDLAKKSALPDLYEDDPFMKVLRDKDAAPLNVYLEVDDYAVFNAVTRWVKSEDPILADLAGRIRERKLFKSLDVSRVKGLREKAAQARQVIKGAGLDPRYYFTIDTSGDIPYKPYDIKKPGRASHILVESPGDRQKTQDIYTVSEVVSGLARAAFTVKRVMFPDFHNGINLRARMTEIFYLNDEIESFLPPY